MASLVEFPLGSGLLNRWFGEPASPEPASEPGKLRALLGEDAERERHHLEQSLAGRPLRRKIATALVVAIRKAG